MSILYWIWSQPQTLIGWIVSLFFSKERKIKYEKALLLSTSDMNINGKVFGYGLTLGKYIIISKSGYKYVKHEWGHSIQSLILGPLYLPLIGITSLFWACLSLCIYLFTGKAMTETEYYKNPFEAWANILGNYNP
jgi:hypothetical protein